MKERKISSSIGKGAVFLFFCLYALLILGPLSWMLVSSLKAPIEFHINSWGFPAKLQWSNYIYAIRYGVGKYFFNSVFVTSTSVIITVSVSALASWVVSRFDFKLRNAVFIFILGGMMISPEVNLISLFKLLQKLRMYDTYWAMIIPYSVFEMAFSVLLMRSYMLSLPREVEESAFIDGCPAIRVFTSIVLPMSRPVLASAALFSAMYAWNEFMFALVFIETDSLKTIPVGLTVLKTSLNTNYPILIAGLVISASVMVVLLLCFQKQFVRGLTQGGVKG